MPYKALKGLIRPIRTRTGLRRPLQNTSVILDYYIFYRTFESQSQINHTNRGGQLNAAPHRYYYLLYLLALALEGSQKARLYDNPTWPRHFCAPLITDETKQRIAPQLAEN